MRQPRFFKNCRAMDEEKRDVIPQIPDL